MSLQIAMLCEPKMTSHVKPTTPTTFGTGQPGPSGRRGNYFSCSKLGATGYSKSTFSFTTFQHLLPNPFALCSRSWGSPGPCRSCPERKTNSLTASICMTGFGVLFLFCFGLKTRYTSSLFVTRRKWWIFQSYLSGENIKNLCLQSFEVENFSSEGKKIEEREKEKGRKRQGEMIKGKYILIR